jgi:hypothetical protein
MTTHQSKMSADDGPGLEAILSTCRRIVPVAERYTVLPVLRILDDGGDEEVAGVFVRNGPSRQDLVCPVSA